MVVEGGGGRGEEGVVEVGGCMEEVVRLELRAS